MVAGTLRAVFGHLQVDIQPSGGEADGGFCPGQISPDDPPHPVFQHGIILGSRTRSAGGIFQKAAQAGILPPHQPMKLQLPALQCLPAKGRAIGIVHRTAKPLRPQTPGGEPGRQQFGFNAVIGSQRLGQIGQQPLEIVVFVLPAGISAAAASAGGFTGSAVHPAQILLLCFSVPESFHGCAKLRHRIGQVPKGRTTSAGTAALQQANPGTGKGGIHRQHPFLGQQHQHSGSQKALHQPLPHPRCIIQPQRGQTTGGAAAQNSGQPFPFAAQSCRKACHTPGNQQQGLPRLRHIQRTAKGCTHTGTHGAAAEGSCRQNGENAHQLCGRQQRPQLQRQKSQQSSQKRRQLAPQLQRRTAVPRLPQHHGKAETQQHFAQQQSHSPHAARKHHHALGKPQRQSSTQREKTAGMTCRRPFQHHPAGEHHQYRRSKNQTAAAGQKIG